MYTLASFRSSSGVKFLVQGLSCSVHQTFRFLRFWCLVYSIYPLTGVKYPVINRKVDFLAVLSRFRPECERKSLLQFRLGVAPVSEYLL